MQYFASSDRGLVRKENQDRFLTLPIEGGCLVAVFDGMGGHAEGGEAASLALSAFTEVFTASPPETVAEGEACLLASARLASDRIRAYAALDEGRLGMGTTVSALLLLGTSVLLLNIGDSRAYLYRAGELFRLTEDDSYVASLVRAGRITPAEARIHPKRNILTRALGTPERALPTVTHGVLRAGDTVLLCSDGLWGRVGDETMRSILSQQLSLTASVGYLIASANEHGGDDNITVALLRV